MKDLSEWSEHRQTGELSEGYEQCEPLASVEGQSEYYELAAPRAGAARGGS